MGLSLGLRLGLSSPSMGGGFNPLQLGASLLDMWDAEDSAKLTLAGSVVSAWASSKNAYSATQASSNARPAYSATGFNGRPSVTFDGVDDELTFTGAGNFPSGATPGELWILVDQVALVIDPATRFPFSYGSANSTGRNINRTVTLAVNRAQGTVGAGSAVTGANSSVDFSGRHVVRLRVRATEFQVDVDGIEGAITAAVPNTTATRLRLGASANSTASGFFNGVISWAGLTTPLTTDESVRLTNYLKARGGIA